MIGIPFRITVGKKLADGKVEFVERRSRVSADVPVGEAIAHLRQKMAARPVIDWAAIRAEFPSLQGRTFLNTATYGQLPRRTKEAAMAHFERRDKTAALDFLEWFDDLDQTRALIARLIHCAPGDIAFVPNAGYALALAMSSVDWKAGDELLTLHHEFPQSTLCAREYRRAWRGMRLARVRSECK